MKSLKSYISESIITEAVRGIDKEILKREYRYPQFPRTWKPKFSDPSATVPNLPTRVLKSIAADIFGCRYGNLGSEAGNMPEYNMFNAMHVKQMVFKTSVEDELKKHGIVVPVASYTADTDLGPQMIYYLTAEGEELLEEIIFK